MVRRYVGNGVWEDVPGTEKKPEASLDVALEDVATRFLTHLPASELKTADRLFFQIEQAHWFYEDFLADAPGAKLPHLHLRAFAQQLFERCELLKPMRAAYESLFNDFRTYKGKIPVCGCVLLDPTLTKLVLVCNWAKTSWGLPKGKLNQHEPKALAAKREVLEETGYDVGYDMADEDCIEVMNKEQNASMFCVPDVAPDFPFEPRVRKEISKVAFFPLDELPPKQWGVDIFVPNIKRWIKRYKRSRNRKRAAAPKKPDDAPPLSSVASAAPPNAGGLADLFALPDGEPLPIATPDLPPQPPDVKTFCLGPGVPFDFDHADLVRPVNAILDRAILQSRHNLQAAAGS